MKKKRSLHFFAAAAGFMLWALAGGAVVQADPVEILTCSKTGTGGDIAESRGIRFTVDENFSAIEVRMAGNIAGLYSLDTEIRRSTGFTTTVERRVQNITLDAPAAGTVPYAPLRISFDEISVSGKETFTIKFTNISGPGILYFETFGIGNDICGNVEETDNNTGINPGVRGDVAGFRVLSGDALVIRSSYTTTAPELDGVVGFGEWPVSNRIEFESGFLTVLNDRNRLYVLLDIINDTGNGSETEDDYFYLSFDVDKNGTITSGSDINYALSRNIGNIRYQYYNGPSSWTTLQPETFSARARGFGCFFADSSRLFTKWPHSGKCNRHFVWEFGIDLMEINGRPGGHTRMGVKIHSSSPEIDELIPDMFYDNFLNLIHVQLGEPDTSGLTQNTQARVLLEKQPMEMTQAIQDLDNTMPLVQDRKTMARIYAAVDNAEHKQPSIVSLYGEKDGIDLPGSPLASYYEAPVSIDRERLSSTANFMLPDTWNQGEVTFTAKVRDFSGQVDASADTDLTFTPKEIPTYWIIPINTGSSSAPNVVSDAVITEQENYLKAIFPVPDVDFVRKPWDIIGATTVASTINDLNDLYGRVVLAWVFGYIFSGGDSPFDMPDQIFGFCPSGGGISNPKWAGGAGLVARGYIGSSQEGTMAHEIIHNLGPGDCSDDNAGFWGRHVSSEGKLSEADDPTGQCIPGESIGVNYGCAAAGPDKAWQETYDDGEIHEVGLDLSASGPRTVSDTTPDIMTYCDYGDLPTKWISSYRWERMFDYFKTVSGTIRASESYVKGLDEIEPVYYVSGVITPKKGKLNPIVCRDGVPAALSEDGTHRILLRDENKKTLFQLGFNVSFFEKEAGDDQSVPFFFQIPVIDGVAKIELWKEENVLDEISVSTSLPIVEVIRPNGGELWSGETETIGWDAKDKDGDILTFSVLFSPDGGLTWMPVAGNIQENEFEVDTSTLPGGSAALIKVIATDGFNTAEDDSDGTFTVEYSAPQVQILEPASDQLFEPGTKIHFLGRASDNEDGNLPDDAFAWFVDGAVFAAGRQIDAVLAEGFHEITLKAHDEDDMIGEQTIWIQIAPTCQADSDKDGDVDGLDLARQAKTLVTDSEQLEAFCSEFGSNACAVIQ
nr:hypothetical protein [uncultured Desulfobacter sp.]